MLKEFEYIKVDNLNELYDLLDKYPNDQVKILAGGTDLLPTLRSGKLSVNYMIDISLLGLDKIYEENGKIHIGPMVTFRKLICDQLVCKNFPELVKAAKTVGAVQTRSLATIGGNISSAVPSCDSAPILIALGAELILKNREQQRTVAVEDYFKGPRRNALNKGEILIDIAIPFSKENAKVSFLKYGRRKALTLAIVNCATRLELDSNNSIIDTRVALGAVAPVPVRARSAEVYLIGKTPSTENIATAAKIAISEISPISDIRASAEYRLQLSEALVKKALAECL